jgi:hypothetical protein
VENTMTLSEYHKYFNKIPVFFNSRMIP